MRDEQSLRIHGSPPFSVAVVHGGPGAAGEMAPVARELSRDFGVLEPFQAAKSVDSQVQELTAILLEHGSSPIALIGHSWGAWLSLILAARHPRILKLAGQIQCPVVAIHGAHDPHPSAGVDQPLSRVLKDFRFILLDKCGHTPWLERQVMESFYVTLRAEIAG